MIVVSNTSPLINLAAIGELDLLRALYHRVCVPEAVRREITAFPDQPGAAEVEALDWIVCRPCQRRDLVQALRGELDEGEAEAVALAVEMEAGLLLIDERAGRRVAARLGVERVGLLGAPVEAKQKGFVAEVRPLINALRGNAGFWISSELEERVLIQAGE